MMMKLSDLIEDETWKEALEPELTKKYFSCMEQFINDQYCATEVFPPRNQIFSALNLLPLDKVKVVLLGQDPYHGLGQANGLSFSVNEGVKIPPSLRNIFKELYSDMGIEATNSGDLSPWAREGVLLLNSTLTVRSASAGSHQKRGWEDFTDHIIKTVSERQDHVVFILWGSFAHKKEILIDSSKHYIIKSVHPSPLSSYRGFFGSAPFSETNEFLKKKGISEINWSL